MQIAASVTVASADNNSDCFQSTSLLRPGIRTTLNCKGRVHAIPDDEIVGGMQLAYVYDEEENRVTVESLDVHFGVYYKLHKSYGTLDEEANSFLVGDLLFQLITERSEHLLKYENIGEEGRVAIVVLDPRIRYTIGRVPTAQTAQEATIRVQGNGVSRNHCCLYFRPDVRSWAVEDCKSTNGVYVQLSKGPHQLGWDELLRIGRNAYVYFSKEAY